MARKRVRIDELQRSVAQDERSEVRVAESELVKVRDITVTEN